MTDRYMSWLMVPGLLLALLGLATLIAVSASNDDRSTDVPLAMLCVGLAVALFGAVWQAEVRRRERITRSNHQS